MHKQKFHQKVSEISRKYTIILRQTYIKLLTRQQFPAKFGRINRLDRRNLSFSQSNKRAFRAGNVKPLLSALRPRLLRIQRSQIDDTVKSEQNHSHFWPFSSSNRVKLCQNPVKIVVVSTILFGFSSFLANFSTPVSAVSLTLSVPSEPLSLDIQPTNTFTKSSSASISAKTDAFAGYALTIKAKTDNNLTSGSSKIASISSNLTEEQYKGSGYTNTWGYQPSKFNSSDNTSFLPGPTADASTIEKTSAKNDTENTYDITLAAKADANTPQGEYQNTFIFSVTANTVSYNITYNLNNGEWSGTSPQTGTTTENTIKLDSNTPTRAGYEFLNWCDQETTDETCGGTTHQPGETITLTNGANSLQLYAMWKSWGFDEAFAETGAYKESGYYKMQDMVPEICDRVTKLPADSVETLIDERDHNLYKVAKLPDGRCWMVQNLRLGRADLETPIEATMSDVSTGFNLPTSTKVGFYSATISDIAYVYVDTSNENYGGYYSWFAATAGTGTHLLGNKEDAPGSICPKGWRLPTGGADGEMKPFVALYNNDVSKLLAQPAPGFVLAGSYYNNSPDYQNSHGYYWTSTSYGIASDGNQVAYSVYLTTTSVTPSTGNRPFLGFSVRCIARDSY